MATDSKTTVGLGGDVTRVSPLSREAELESEVQVGSSPRLSLAEIFSAIDLEQVLKTIRRPTEPTAEKSDPKRNLAAARLAGLRGAVRGPGFRYEVDINRLTANVRSALAQTTQVLEYGRTQILMRFAGSEGDSQDT